ncbi:hypothetical protein [Segnochrobactrum spirostomi]|uniref:Uncharacterized protein n=1 Tax=Segnochrobactrum spirostomi TaxID=2608987 RepID=A0A6A7Y8V1_9HYPH|nr:hypothetical protein [Segnochrobactrum spirostomi]MQT14408.1 hypothetical protein [Segnochrobactrum spirostomi]
MRPAAAAMLELDTALRQLDLATVHLSRGAGKRSRRRVLEACAAVRAVGVRLMVAEAAAAGLDVTPAGARAALRALLAELRATGALDWADVVTACNEVADSAPRRLA